MSRNIELGRLFRKYIHFPKTKMGTILYVKVDGATEENKDNENMADNDNEYKSVKNLVYNSPTNIRRIIISATGAMVAYHEKYKTNNGNKGSKIKEFSADDNLIIVAQRIGKYNAEMYNYQQMKSAGRKADKPERTVVNGKFNLASSPYALSNVEEIYFDWTLLMSPEILKFFSMQIGAQTVEQLVHKMLQYNGTDYIENDICTKLFVEQSNGGTRDIASKFPRLREIAMISNLSELLKMKGLQDEFSYARTVNSDSGLTWLDKVLPSIKNIPGTMIIRSKIRNYKVNKNFIVKTSQYKFDADSLSVYVKRYVDELNKIASPALENETKQSSDEEIKANQPETIKMIEAFLEDIGENGDIKGSIILKHAYNASYDKKEVWEAIIKQFTSENKRIYGSALGFRI